MSAPWDCPSCGTAGQVKSFCEACGAAMPVEGEDSALSLMLGIVCERCDGYNDPGGIQCVSCGAPLPSVEGSGKFPAFPDAPPPAVAATPAPAPAPAAAAGPAPMWMAAPEGQPLATAFALPRVDLATVAAGQPPATLAPPPTPVAPAPAPVPPAPAPMPTPAPTAAPACAKCGTALAADDRFCRNCGQRVGEAQPPSTTQISAFKLPAPGLPSPVLGPQATMMMPSFGGLPKAAEPPRPAATMFFGAATAERVAKLVLVRGHSQFGSQWRLQATETVIGRSDGVVLFPDDEALAHRHCRLTWRGNDLWLEPEATTNGVFLRVRGPTHVGPGDEIVVGAQRLRVLADADRLLHTTSPDAATKVLGSMVRPTQAITLLRIAPDPVENEVFHRQQRLLTLGRNRCDVNFPRDGFVSERHAQLARTDEGPLLLEDLKSRNGTYVRLRAPERILHGDLLLLGDKVLRVELPR